MRGGADGDNAEGLAVVVGDDDTASRTGMRLPVRYSFSSDGFCAVCSGADSVAQAESASARKTKTMRRCMRRVFPKNRLPPGQAKARWRKKAAIVPEVALRARKT